MTGIVIVSLLLLSQLAIIATRVASDRWNWSTWCNLAAAIFLSYVLARMILEELRDRRFRRAIAERVRR